MVQDRRVPNSFVRLELEAFRLRRNTLRARRIARNLMIQTSLPYELEIEERVWVKVARETERKYDDLCRYLYGKLIPFEAL